jgi:tRNA (cmo5U34)-methyltransferase
MKAGDNIKTSNASWSFSGEVVEKFDSHIEKSVPLYKEGHQLITNASDFFVKNDSTIYELGSSTGELLNKIKTHNQMSKPDAKYIGIDIEQDMVNFSNNKYKDKNIEFLKDDIVEFDYEKSDMIISYYTIQFIRPSVRQLLIDKIYNSLNWGGAFLFFEKVRANDARFQDITTALYNEYKIAQGYSFEEIMAKSRSLKGILEPFSTQGNIDMLKRAGFVDIITIHKHINFEGFLAIK